MALHWYKILPILHYMVVGRTAKVEKFDRSVHKKRVTDLALFSDTRFYPPIMFHLPSYSPTSIFSLICQLKTVQSHSSLHTSIAPYMH